MPLVRRVNRPAVIAGEVKLIELLDPSRSIENMQVDYPRCDRIEKDEDTDKSRANVLEDNRRCHGEMEPVVAAEIPRDIGAISSPLKVLNGALNFHYGPIGPKGCFEPSGLPSLSGCRQCSEPRNPGRRQNGPPMDNLAAGLVLMVRHGSPSSRSKAGLLVRSWRSSQFLIRQGPP